MATLLQLPSRRMIYLLAARPARAVSSGGRTHDLPLPRIMDATQMAGSGTGSKVQTINVWKKYFYSGQLLTASGASVEAHSMPLDLSPERLSSAHYIASERRVSLRFFDGLTAMLDLVRLGIDISGLKLGTVRVSSLGSAIEVEDLRGKTIDIDSAVLRSYCDPAYATELRKAIAEVTAR
jgi:hypothetical protein